MSSSELTDLKRKVQEIWRRLQEKHKTKGSTEKESKKWKDSEMKDAFQLLWVVEFRVLEHEENDLAKSLQKLCTPYGDERESKLNETSEILFSMGRLYVKKAEVTTGMEQKLNFIKAAALLHGARVRFEMHLKDKVKAKNVFDTLEQMESNLLMSCKGILPATETLMQISWIVKMTFEFLRGIEEPELEKLEIIPETAQEADARKKQQEKIKQVQYMMEKNTFHFTGLMGYVARKCLDILGKPPCRFAIAGLGSLARREITLYSDFEHVILLEEGVQDSPEYESFKEYFRWFAVVFQVIIIGLGETIIRSIGVKSLNNLYSSDQKNNWFYDAITPSGVAIDGMMPHACKTPLGRQELTEKKKHVVELIQPVSKMASLLTSVEDLKNGYKMRDVLSQSCFVVGYKELFCDFRRQAFNILCFEDEIRKNILSNWSSMKLRELSDKFCPVIDQKVLLGPQIIDTKTSYYRPLSVNLSYLGRIKKVWKPSCFEIISNCFQDESQHKMLWAFAVACELRMKIYARGRGNRLKVSQRLFPFVGTLCFRNCLEQMDNLSVMLKNQSTTNDCQDLSIQREANSLMTSGSYKEASEILGNRIHDLQSFDRYKAYWWSIEHKWSLALCCYSAGVSSQKPERARLFEEAKMHLKSLEGTQHEDDGFYLLYRTYLAEGQFCAVFDLVVMLLEREGDSTFTKFKISCLEFGRAIWKKFPCSSSVIDFCDKALGKYKGFHSQVAFRYGKTLAMVMPQLSSGVFVHDSRGRKDLRDLVVIVQNGIRDLRRLLVLHIFDRIFDTQLFHNWWEDALVTMESSEIIRKSKYQDNYSPTVTAVRCGTAIKYLIKSMLEKNFTTKYELFCKCFQSFGDSKTFMGCKRSFCYFLNIVAMHQLQFIDVETPLLLQYSRELKPEGLDNFEKRTNIMSQLLLLLSFYRCTIAVKHDKIFDVADDLIDILVKFSSLLHHPLFLNALHAIADSCYMPCAISIGGYRGKFVQTNVDKRFGQIRDKMLVNLELAGESLSRKKYREGVRLWLRSDFKRCTDIFWKIINFKKADFLVRARSIAMFYHSVVALNGMEFTYSENDCERSVVAAKWPFELFSKTSQPISHRLLSHRELAILQLRGSSGI